jgi:hypothetical protein
MMTKTKMTIDEVEDKMTTKTKTKNQSIDHTKMAID